MPATSNKNDQTNILDIQEKTLVIIPARNEKDSIVEVIQELQQRGWHHIRVVDNGSTDNITSRAQECGVEVVQEPQAGYGSCMLDRLPKSRGKPSNGFCSAMLITAKSWMSSKISPTPSPTMILFLAIVVPILKDGKR